MKRIILILTIGSLISCSNHKAKQSIDSFTNADSSILRFIRLYESYIDATYDWHEETVYNISVDIQQKDDTLIYRFDANNPKDIWPQIKECKYCYTIDNHKIFSNQRLFSIKSQSIDSVLKLINPGQYEIYKKYKEPLPIEMIWDTKGLKVVYFKNQLQIVEFVW